MVQNSKIKADIAVFFDEEKKNYELDSRAGTISFLSF
jgi:hypothetical protein